jgi:hypothetical protein
VNDERLLTEVNAAATEESERVKKRAGAHKTIAMASHTSAQTATGETEMLVEIIKSLKEEVKSLRAEVADLSSNA